MANKVIIFAIVLIAIVGLASAATTAEEASSPSLAVPIDVPSSDDAIGTDDGSDIAPSGDNDGVVAGPLGATSAEGPSAQAPSATSAASTLEFTALVGVAAVASYFAL